MELLKRFYFGNYDFYWIFRINFIKNIWNNTFFIKFSSIWDGFVFLMGEKFRIPRSYASFFPHKKVRMLYYMSIIFFYHFILGMLLLFRIVFIFIELRGVRPPPPLPHRCRRQRWWWCLRRQSYWRKKEQNRNVVAGRNEINIISE